MKDLEHMFVHLAVWLNQHQNRRYWYQKNETRAKLFFIFITSRDFYKVIDQHMWEHYSILKTVVFLPAGFYFSLPSISMYNDREDKKRNSIKDKMTFEKRSVLMRQLIKRNAGENYVDNDEVLYNEEFNALAKIKSANLLQMRRSKKNSTPNEFSEFAFEFQNFFWNVNNLLFFSSIEKSKMANNLNTTGWTKENTDIIEKLHKINNPSTTESNHCRVYTYIDKKLIKALMNQDRSSLEGSPNISKYGELQHNNAFIYQHLNGQVKNLVKSSYAVLEQIASNFELKFFEFKVNGSSRIENTEFKLTGKSYLNDGKDKCFKTAENRSTSITSSNNSSSKVKDFYVETYTSGFFKVEYFVEENGKEFFVGKKFKRFNNLNNLCFSQSLQLDYITKVQLTNDQEKLELNQIKQKVLFQPKFKKNESSIQSSNSGFIIIQKHKIHN